MSLKQRLSELPVVGTALAVQERTKADAADQFGAAIAFHGFISLFPLIAIVAAVTGLVLAGRPGPDADAIIGEIRQAIPGLGGDTIDRVFEVVIANAGSIGLVGLGLALFTGLRVTNAAQTATRFVFGVDLADTRVVRTRALQLGSLVVLGLLAIAGVAASGWVQGVALAADGTAGVLGPMGAWLGSATFDVALFWVAYRMYSVGVGMGWRDLLPGALFGGIGWAALKYFGGAYLARQAEGSVVTGSEDEAASAALALLATMIGLLLLFYLAGRLYVYGAELAAELAGLPRRGGSGEDGQDEAAAGDGRDDDPDDGADATVSGSRDGLLAALQAHERRRGVDSPPTEDELAARAALFADGDGAGSAGGRADADTDAAHGADDQVATPAAADERAPSADGDGVDDHPGLDDQAGPDDRAGPDDHPGLDDEAGPDDPAGSDDPAGPDGTEHGDEADGDGDEADGDGAGVATSDWTQDDAEQEDVPAGGAVPGGTHEHGADAGGTAVVPWAPESRGLFDDPTTRRVAAAAAIGLVGLAAGLWQRRNRD